jgi:hypothetical protein
MGVGSTVGRMVGADIGNAVGCAVGFAVGLRVGGGIGVADGSVVGTGVGVLLGCGVGRPSHRQHISFELKSSSSRLPHWLVASSSLVYELQSFWPVISTAPLSVSTQRVGDGVEGFAVLG